MGVAESYWVTRSCAGKRVFLVGKSGGGGVKIFLGIVVSDWESTKYFLGVVRG
jgi:hypothetical protein